MIKPSKKMGSYYPFGLEHKGYNNVVNGTENKYQTYNGKELDESLGLNWLDFDTRNYDASLGRWMNLDPMAEDMRRYSPYTFAFDNPIYYIDPDGMMPIGVGGMDDEKNFDFNVGDGPQHITSTVVDESGKIIDYKDDGDDNIYLNERSAENVIGTEQEGVEYNVGGYLTEDDLNEGAIDLLPDGFLLNIKLTDTQNQLYFWPAEVINGGLIKVGSWLNKLRLLKFGSRIKASNVKQLKALIKKLSKPGSELTAKELKKLEKLVEKFGGKIRRDLNPVKGKIKKPHVQVEGLGKSIESRHIWLKNGVN